MIKIMSFNVRSIQSWKITENNAPISDDWVEYFLKIVNTNDSDIVFLQEVKLKHEEINVLKNALYERYNQEWCSYDTGAYSSKWNENLNNAILYRKRINCEDITQNYFPNSQTEMEKLQIIKFTHDNKIRIGLNVHLSNDTEGQNKIIDNFHGDEFRRICDLLLKLQINYPDSGVFAIGDYNFAAQYLKTIMQQKNMPEWTIDYETIFTAGQILTTVTYKGESKNPMDHFIYNPKSIKIEKQLFNNEESQGEYDINLGVVHLNHQDNPDVAIDKDTVMKANDYYYCISDHYPITVHIM